MTQESLVERTSFSLGTQVAVVLGSNIELVSKELNHLVTILHVYAGGLNFMK